MGALRAAIDAVVRGAGLRWRRTSAARSALTDWRWSAATSIRRRCGTGFRSAWRTARV